MSDPMTWVTAIGIGLSAATTVKDLTEKPDKPPPLEKPTPAPDDAQIDAARRRRSALARQQSGVRAASLTTPGSRETLG